MANCAERLASLDPTLLAEPDCYKLMISKALGLGIVAGSALVKVPQIVKMTSAASAEGLSGASIALELLANVSSVSYYVGMSTSYPFTTWGENCFLLAQNLAIFLLLLKYTGTMGSRGPLGLLGYGVVGAVLSMRLVPDVPLPAAVCAALRLRSCTLTCEQLAGVLPIVIGVFSRLPQIMQNVRQRHTGQLAMLTFLLNTLGGAARVFTTLQELDDRITLVAVLAGFVQNFVILGQILTYGGPKPAKRE
jgi:mannose-P-dolichol utilization defect protein 1